jgi:ATP-dependent Zn protease
MNILYSFYMFYKLQYFFMIITFSKIDSFQDVLEPINIKSKENNKDIIEKNNYPIMNQNLEVVLNEETNQNLEVVVNEKAEDNVNKEYINDNDDFFSKLSEYNKIHSIKPSLDIKKIIIETFINFIILIFGMIVGFYLYIYIYKVRECFSIIYLKKWIKRIRKNDKATYDQRKSKFDETFIYPKGDIAEMIEDLNIYFKSFDKDKKEEKKSKVKYVALYGPPGSGKTVFAKAFAKLHKAKFFTTNAGNFYSMFFSGATTNVQNFLQKIRDTNGPAVGFIDEIESIAATRVSGTNSEALNKLLTYDFTSSEYPRVIFYATNRIQDIDPALTRAERTTYMLKIDTLKLPDAREEKEYSEFEEDSNKSVVKRKIAVMVGSHKLLFDKDYNIQKMKTELEKIITDVSSIEDFFLYLQINIKKSKQSFITEKVVKDSIKTLIYMIKERKDINWKKIEEGFVSRVRERRVHQQNDIPDLVTIIDQL